MLRSMHMLTLKQFVKYFLQNNKPLVFNSLIRRRLTTGFTVEIVKL